MITQPTHKCLSRIEKAQPRRAMPNIDGVDLRYTDTHEYPGFTKIDLTEAMREHLDPRSGARAGAYILFMALTDLVIGGLAGAVAYAILSGWRP